MVHVGHQARWERELKMSPPRMWATYLHSMISMLSLTEETDTILVRFVWGGKCQLPTERIDPG